MHRRSYYNQNKTISQTSIFVCNLEQVSWFGWIQKKIGEPRSGSYHILKLETSWLKRIINKLCVKEKSLKWCFMFVWNLCLVQVTVEETKLLALNKSFQSSKKKTTKVFNNNTTVIGLLSYIEFLFLTLGRYDLNI